VALGTVKKNFCFPEFQRRSSELKKNGARNCNVDVFCLDVGVILRNVEDILFDSGDILLNASVFLCDFF